MMKAADFRRRCNSDLILKYLPHHAPITTRRAHRWLGALGFVKTTHRKGMYVDGHERPDVVGDRNRFLAEMEGFQNFMDTYGGALMLTRNGASIRLPSGHRLVLVVHDETCFHLNDRAAWSYRTKGDLPLMQKSMGGAVHVSGFLSEEHSLLLGGRRGAPLAHLGGLRSLRGGQHLALGGGWGHPGPRRSCGRGKRPSLAALERT